MAQGAACTSDIRRDAWAGRKLGARKGAAGLQRDQPDHKEGCASLFDQYLASCTMLTI